MVDERPSAANGVALAAVGEALAALKTATNERITADRAEIAARGSVYDALRVLAEHAEVAQRLEVARRLYWTQPDLRVRPMALALGFGNEYELRQIVGTWPTGQVCARCASELRLTARSSSPGHSVPEFDGPICDSCWRIVQEARHRVWDRRRTTQVTVATARIDGPSTWWRVLTSLVLAYPPITADIDDDDSDYVQDQVWEAFTVAQTVADRDHRDVTVGEAMVLVRGAESVAAWHPGQADRIVEAELGDVIFAGLLTSVGAAVAKARQHALDLFDGIGSND